MFPVPLLLGRRRECARELLAQRVDARVPVELVHTRHADGHTLDDAEDRVVGVIVEHFDIGVGVDRPVGEAAADGRCDRAGGDLIALRRAVDDRVLPAGVAQRDLRAGCINCADQRMPAGSVKISPA